MGRSKNIPQPTALAGRRASAAGERLGPQAHAPRSARTRAHRFAVATAVATFVLLIVGSLVHGTGSSLACPDWPLCYGTFFPKLENGVEFEHTHRLVATAVGLMTLALLALLARTRDPQLLGLGGAAAILVVVQGILGGITVLYQLPRAISIAHLATSMCFFSMVLVIALRTGPSSSVALPGAAKLRREVAFAWTLVLVQIILGGLVRHTASGLACLDVPLCHGVLVPGAARERVQMLHRFGALVAGSVAVLVALRVRRWPQAAPALRRLALMPIALVAAQIALGVGSVLSLLNLTIITAHLAVGAALLGSLVVLFERLRQEEHRFEMAVRGTLRCAPLKRAAISLTALFLVGAVLLQRSRTNSRAALPVLLQIEPFSLIDQRGQVVSLSDLRGRVWVADFIFTGCQSACPMLTSRMRALQDFLDRRERELGQKLPVRLVSFSVDAEVDTPERLREYAARFGADQHRWLFLTGSLIDVNRAVTGSMKIPFEKGRTDISAFDIMHGEHFVIVDGQGRIRGYFDPDAEGMARIEKAVEALAAAERGST
jgi:protein SCO1/2